MRRFIVFLRAINVGGRNVTMTQLRAHFEMLGLAHVESFIASGNVIFQAAPGDLTALQRNIENHLATSLGYEVAAFLRTDAEVAAIARYRPFSQKAIESAAALNVALLAEPLDAKGARALLLFKTAIDDFHAHGREVYWLCRKKQSESTFSHGAFEKALELRATFRGINTIRKLATKYPAVETGTSAS